MAGKKYTRKQIKKSYEGRCFICGESNYELLDAHRLKPGESGGVYIEENMIVLCANDHRRVHSGEIVIDERKYTYTGPGHIIHLWVNGDEFWIPEHKGYFARDAGQH